MKSKTVYGAMFNPMIHESVYAVISLHWDKKDAEMAMEFHKHETLLENGIDSCMAWTIYEFNIK